MTFEGDIPPEAKAIIENMLAPPEGRFISVSAGFLFTCGVRIDNSAECWSTMAIPSGGVSPPEGKYTSISAGGFHACGIRIDQTVVCWGSDQGFDGDFLGQATPPDGPFEVINAGGYHTCGFKPDGEIRCWGSIVGGAWRRVRRVLRTQTRSPLLDGRAEHNSGLRVATRRHQPVLDGRGGDRGQQIVGRQRGRRSRRRPQGHGQRQWLFVCVVGRWPHRVLGIRRYQ